MNHKNVIGKFMAITFDNEVYEFIVKDTGVMYCEELLKDVAITQLVLSPNYQATIEGNKGVITCKSIAMEKGKNVAKSLIKKYDIFPDLLAFLVEKNAIVYDEAKAWLYELNPKYAIKSRNAYKRIKKK